MKYVFLIIPLYGIYVFGKRICKNKSFMIFLLMCIALGIISLLFGRKTAEIIAGAVK